jgi:hypothetical protein
MPRNASGTYTLPSGNPVVSGTLIDATWANNTMADLGNEVTDSLSRSGEGAMLAPLRITDGVQATPSLAFSNEPSSGLYRAGTNEWWSVAAGVQVQQHTSTGAVTRFAAGAVGTPSVSAFNDVNTGIWFPAADTLAVSTAGVEALRVNSSGVLSLVNNPTLSGGTANGVLFLNGSKVATSGNAFVFDGTNVGIGTASPDANFKLDVQAATGRIKLTSTTGTNSVVYQANNTGGTLNVGIDSSTGGSLFGVGAYAAGVWYSGNYPLVFGVNNAEGFRLTSTSLYTASGINVGIGTSSPGQKLTVQGGINVTSSATLPVAQGPMLFSYEAPINRIYMGDGTGYSFAFSKRASSTTTDLMTLTDGGNLGIGTTSPTYRLTVLTPTSDATVGFNLRAYTTGADGDRTVISRYTSSNDLNWANSKYQAWAYIWETNGTEKARITSGGYSKFSNDGTYASSTGAYHEFHSSDAAQPILYLTATSGSYTGQTIYINNTRAASSAYKFYSANANAVEQFYVRGDGVLYAQNTTIQSLSDGRLKENIRNATEGLDVINALRPIRYDWKTGFGNDRKNQLGFVAQEVEAVFPDAVSEWSKTEGDEEPYKTVGPGALIPVLVKAIQEQQAMIKSLEAKVAALEIH